MVDIDGTPNNFSSMASSSSHYSHNVESTLNPPSGYTSPDKQTMLKSTSGDSVSKGNSSSRTRNRMQASHRPTKPTINDSPELVSLVYKYIEERNIDGLALIASQRGLPHHLRQLVWPLLLIDHPFVKKPYISPKTTADSFQDEEQHTLSFKKIRTDLDRYRKHSHRHTKHNQSKHNSNNAEHPSIENNNEDHQYYTHDKISTVPTLEDQMFHAIEEAIIRFLRKWGELAPYETGMAWTALGLAEWIPPVPYTNYVLNGRARTATGSFNYQQQEEFDSVTDSITTTTGPAYHNTFSEINTPSSPSLSSSVESSSEASTPLLNGCEFFGDALDCTQTYLKRKPELKFYEAFERLMLVLLHSPENLEEEEEEENENENEHEIVNENEHEHEHEHEHGKENKNEHESKSNQKHKTEKEKKDTNNKKQKSKRYSNSSDNDDLPLLSGEPFSDRISIFLYTFRKQLPELDRYFYEEDVLSSSGGDEWLLWWIKWIGAKVWSKYDRGRIWDIYLGYRETVPIIKEIGSKPEKFTNEENEDNGDQPVLYLEQSQIKELGGDSFWSPMDFDPTDEETAFRKSSILSLFSPSKKNNAPIEPYIKHIFICLAMLKSKEVTLLELDQSEIREYLSRVSTLRSHSTSQYVSTLNLSKMPSNSTSTSADEGSMTALKPPISDVENIVLEGGELWRAWLWSEMVEDDS